MTEKCKIAIVGNVSREKIEILRAAYPEATFLRYDKAEDMPGGLNAEVFYLDEAQDFDKKLFKDIEKEAEFTNRPMNRRERRAAMKKARGSK